MSISVQRIKNLVLGYFDDLYRIRSVVLSEKDLKYFTVKDFTELYKFCEELGIILTTSYYGREVQREFGYVVSPSGLFYIVCTSSPAIKQREIFPYDSTSEDQPSFSDDYFYKAFWVDTYVFKCPLF